jgi:hypothetical protein
MYIAPGVKEMITIFGNFLRKVAIFIKNQWFGLRGNWQIFGETIFES